MSRPDLNLLVALDVLLAEGSVARAAVKLKLSASAMSRTLARLREATGDPLLVRAGRRLVPTPRALELRGRVGALVQDAEAVLRPVQEIAIDQLARTFTLRTSEGSARFIQGLGGAAIMALGIALLRAVVSEAELGTAIGWNTLAVASASAAGPTLGALVLSVADWPVLFAINLPLGVLVLLATRALPEVPGNARPFDATSIVLVPLELLGARSFRISVIASVCCFIGQGAAMVSLVFHLQHTLQLTALQAGLLITPWPVTVAIVAPLAGRFASAWSCAVGGGLLALGLAASALWRGSALGMIPFMVLCGAGFGLFQVANNRNMFLSTPPESSGAVGGMQSTARLTGQTLGAVIMALLFAQASLENAPRIGLGLASGLTLSAGLISLLRATPACATVRRGWSVGTVRPGEECGK